MKDKKVNEITIGELLFLIKNSIKISFKEESNKTKEIINQGLEVTKEIINQRFENLEKELDKINQKFENINQKFNYMESEIRTIKLTQNHMKIKTDFVLEKPLDSVSLSSFLTEEQEENSFFKLFR